MKRILRATTFASAIALSACSGGGGGGGVNTMPPATGGGTTPTPTPGPSPSPTPGTTPTPSPTPTPAPTPTPTPTPTPANASMLNLTASQSFANDGAGGNANFPKSGAMPTLAASSKTMTVAYDASNASYTVTAPGRSQTFRASDIDAARSTAQVTLYTRNSGGTEESLTITKPGTSGRFTYQYVAGGYWERIVTGSTSIDGSLDAFAYGLPTATAATPRTGTAHYSVDLLGAQLDNTTLTGITGSGSLDADFGRGALTVHAELDTAHTPRTAFSGEARISSTDNSFSGPVRFSDIGAFSGAMTGRFYGPGAEEVGASWYASATSPLGQVAAGTIIGRREGALPAATSFADPRPSQFFAGDVSTSSGSFTGTTASNQATGRGTFIVQYDADRRTYTMIGADRSQYYGPTTLSNGIGDRFTVFTPGALQYVRAAEAQHRVMNGQPWQFVIDDVTFGYATADTALPRTGSAAYDLALNGSIFHSGDPQPIQMDGSGTLSVNFGTGAIDLVGGARAGSNLPNNAIAAGGFSGTAALSSTANRFSGTFQLDLFGAHNGTIDGRFYGPTAQEVGASFAVADAGGNVASGTLTGISNPAILEGRKTLAELTAPTDFTSGYSLVMHWQYPINNRGFITSNAGLVSANQSMARVRWDPATNSYLVSRPLGGGSDGEAFSIGFGQADKVAAESSAIFSVYRGTAANNVDWTAKIYATGAGNGELALTYTSFVDFTRVRNYPPGLSKDNDHYFMPFGVATLDSQLPRTGTANYAGVLYGHGAITPAGSNTSDFYALSGTSSMSVNFAGFGISGSLAIKGANGGATTDFGRFDFTGNRNNANFSMGQTSAATTGYWLGQFNGPAAAEYGGVFNIQTNTVTPGYDSINGQKLILTGVTVGKKTP